jgi:hypothetical protein
MLWCCVRAPRPGRARRGYGRTTRGFRTASSVLHQCGPTSDVHLLLQGLRHWESMGTYFSNNCGHSGSINSSRGTLETEADKIKRPLQTLSEKGSRRSARDPYPSGGYHVDTGACPRNVDTGACPRKQARASLSREGVRPAV